MRKTGYWARYGLFLTLLLPFATQASCRSTEAAIRARIQAHGVADFSLQVVPADRVAPLLRQEGGKVVGECRNHTRKIIYRRGTRHAATAPADRN